MKKIFCCACEKEIKPVLKTGKDIYPGRKELTRKCFWQCSACNNYVGCHHRTLLALGTIATPLLRNCRAIIHNILDPLWKRKIISRSSLYKKMNSALNKRFHTAEINNVAEYNLAYEAAIKIEKELLINEKNNQG